MSVRTILRLGHPALRKRCTRVRDFGGAELRALLDDLRDTLADFRLRNGFGRGIAAPQIGDTRSVVVINVDEPLALINPAITRQSRTMMTLWDDCFSFPDLAVKVKRHLSIEVQYRDVEGHRRVMKAKGALAELLQHEIDHCHGILAIDRAIDARHIIYKSELERHRSARARKEM
jgi:peptide deformylase